MRDDDREYRQLMTVIIIACFVIGVSLLLLIAMVLEGIFGVGGLW